MDTMVRHMYENTSAKLHEVLRMATLTPAERVDMANDVGSLEPGKRADLILLDPSLSVQEVYMDGRPFHVA
jgi:N-acetylglucosamine-6-phosphate deacetylase